MAAYLIADTLLQEPDTYEEYKQKARPLAEAHGGRYLVRGGAMDLLEDDLWSPTRMVVIEFPDADTARRFYHSAEYQAILPISKKSAKRSLILIEGI